MAAGALPHASAEVDEAHLDVMARAYRSALLEVLVAARDAREALKNLRCPIRVYLAGSKKDGSMGSTTEQSRSQPSFSSFSV